MRTKAKRDSNEREIITALEAIGCKVWQVSDDGIPDLLVLSPSDNWLVIEVKSAGGKLTAAQVDFIESAGKKYVCVAYTVDDAVQHVFDVDGVEQLILQAQGGGK